MEIPEPKFKPGVNVVNGFNFAPQFEEKNILSALSYKVRDDDIFIATYPKCGTTWTQQILVLIFDDGEPLVNQHLYSRIPFIEAMGAQTAETIQRPGGALKTHLPFEMVPYNPKAKYLFILRNPKDACVSFYYHTKLFKEYKFDGDFHDYLLCWLRGEVECGKYDKHTLSWWQHRNDDNVLVLLYEDMKSNIRDSILKIAKFIGEEYETKIRNNPEILEKIVKHSDINFMRETTNKVYEQRSRAHNSVAEDSDYKFIRKGIVGDWKRHFTPEDNILFERWFKEAFKGTEVEIVNGLNFPTPFQDENIISALNYEAKDDDLFIATFPKCGTTWTQQILVLIFDNGEPSVDVLLSTRSPFLEPMGAKAAESMQKPGAIKTHLPFNVVPYNKNAKYIYVMRNPKDACVSFYYHTLRVKAHEFEGDFHDYMLTWLRGEVEGGKYDKHVLDWWNHKNDDNVLILLYEDMKTNIRDAILKIAKFIGEEYESKLIETPEVIEKIVKYSDFNFMQETRNKQFEYKQGGDQQPEVKTKKVDFFRKGIVGDWKNHFTEEENILFENWFHECFKGTEIESLWDKYKIFEYRNK
ncbi:sulfotransferase-like protein [Leptotrombidium deliense]|uniref:Sulfotransferase-like protein n=1 Tax=Leptotrombidium deliense TaxID=299467 RepID=A0A443SM87_9ACAR|nr:sulfotransferase-like protein [Leptotrombidium deliense]